jgi:hypothetical protein
MSLHTFPDVEQGTDEWLELRRGILTASTIGQLITPSLKPASNQAARSLTLTLVAERITGHIDPVFVSDDMLRGQMEEPLARDAYSEFRKANVEQIGFMTEDRWGFTIGASPDGLVGNDGGIEVKSRRAKKHLQTILSDAVPPENMAQVQTCMLVSGREWWDYISYSAGLPLWVKRAYPDKKWQQVILIAAEAFEREAAQMIDQYKSSVEGLPVMERIDWEGEIQL